MTDTYTETILYNIVLPEPLITFKNNCLSILLPPLNSIVNDLENPQSNKSTLYLLLAILLFLIIRQIANSLFVFKAPQVRLVAQEEIDNEIKLLNNQIRNLKSSLKKIIEQNTGGNIGKVKEGRYNEQEVELLVNNYREAAQDFNNLAVFILDSQESILKEMKMIKKLKSSGIRTPSHTSDPIDQEQIDQKTKNIQGAIEEKKQIKQIKSNVQLISSMVQETKETKINVPVPKAFKAPAIGGKKRIAPPPPIPR